MKEIGGFLDLSANWKPKTLEGSPLMLNSARNCIRYLARLRNIQRVHIPIYTCHTVQKALKKEFVEIKFYSIDSDFRPILPEDINNEYIIYTNYYGIMDSVVIELSAKYKNLIVDNAQAFFSKPLPDVDTVSSPRKFFGLPDGGLLYPGSDLHQENLHIDKSSDRILPMAKRIDYGASETYDSCLSVRKELEDSPVMQMSEITQMLLRSVDFEFAAERRRGNWKTLHEKLKSTNRFEFSLKDAHVPLFYPYLSHGKELREYLIENKVYVAMYWPGIKEVVPEDSFEFDLVENMLPLPIDQRYDSEDMREITRLINEFES